MQNEKVNKNISDNTNEKNNQHNNEIENDLDIELIRQDIWQKLDEVIDPEIGLSVISLGLIYNIEIESKRKAIITMTLTSMACPYGAELKAQVHANATHIIPDVKVEVVFKPAWNPKEMASSEAKVLMGIYD